MTRLECSPFPSSGIGPDRAMRLIQTSGCEVSERDFQAIGIEKAAKTTRRFAVSYALGKGEGKGGSYPGDTGGPRLGGGQLNFLEEMAKRLIRRGNRSA